MVLCDGVHAAFVVVVVVRTFLSVIVRCCTPWGDVSWCRWVVVGARKCLLSRALWTTNVSIRSRIRSGHIPG